MGFPEDGPQEESKSEASSASPEGSQNVRLHPDMAPVKKVEEGLSEPEVEQLSLPLLPAKPGKRANPHSSTHSQSSRGHDSEVESAAQGDFESGLKSEVQEKKSKQLDNVESTDEVAERASPPKKMKKNGSVM